MNGIFNRAELLLGKEALDNIHNKHIIVFGVGGVGSWCAECLVRTGALHLTVVDSDRVCESNVNRQMMATTRTIGQLKVEALKNRLLEISPNAIITTVSGVYNEETNESFRLDEYDYIIDCIDSLKDKASLLYHATRTHAKVYSSMGAALKIDPTQIRVAEFWKVRGCPLGAALRKKMKRAKMTLEQKVQCVYSEELLENKGQCDALDGMFQKAQVNGSLMHITAIYGCMLAGLVIKDIVTPA